MEGGRARMPKRPVAGRHEPLTLDGKETPAYTLDLELHPGRKPHVAPQGGNFLAFQKVPIIQC